MIPEGYQPIVGGAMSKATPPKGGSGEVLAGQNSTAGSHPMKHFPNFKEAQSCGCEMLGDLKHAVGYPEFNRNNYAAALEVENVSLRWECLVSLGLAARGPVIPYDDGTGRYYYVTPAGLEFLRSLAGQKI